MSEGLKPCPFCGGEAILASGGPEDGWINCKNCGCKIEGPTLSRDDVVKAWNARYEENMVEETLESIIWSLNDRASHGYDYYAIEDFLDQAILIVKSQSHNTEAKAIDKEENKSFDFLVEAGTPEECLECEYRELMSGARDNAIYGCNAKLEQCPLIKERL